MWLWHFGGALAVAGTTEHSLILSMQDDDPLQCQPQPSEGTGGGKEADHDGHPLLVFDKVLVRSDVEQGLYVPTEKAKVVKQMAEGSSPFDPILIEVR